MSDLLDRRHCVRHKVQSPAYASFDGVTGGMVLDLSEQGMAMLTEPPLDAGKRLRLNLSLTGVNPQIETTGYVAWADALGRAGVRFSELPAEARRRLDEWLEKNDGAPSRKAPTVTVNGGSLIAFGPTAQTSLSETRVITLEAHSGSAVRSSTTAQYEFNSLGTDLNAALRLISERARSLTRGSGAAIALLHNGSMICRASVGSCAPALGSRVDSAKGFSGECVRSAKSMRCDDTENDQRVEIESCRRLAVRSILAAPVQYERSVIGLLEIFSTVPFAFDEGDVAVAERLAQTVLLALSQMTELPRG
jgi:putative methionine-R-sulfoxide reductase with GAF domain